MTSMSGPPALPAPRRVAWGWVLTALVATGVSLASTRYLLSGVAMAPPPLKPNFMHHQLAFWLHIGGGSTALLVGPWQFLGRLRRGAPVLHRLLGLVYVSACLVGALAALPMALGSNGGWVAAAGFETLALLWLWTTLRAVLAVRSGDIAAHRLWMVRSFSLTLAGVTLRLYLPLALIGLAPFSVIYAGIAWLCWAPNLLMSDRIGAALGAPRPQAGLRRG